MNWNHLTAALALLAAPLSAQTRTLAVGSVSLRAAKITASATNLCSVFFEVSGLRTTGSGDIVPANVRQWMDTTAYIARAAPPREKGEQLDYRWSIGRLGVSRSVNDRMDSLSLLFGGTAIPATADELPKLFRLVESAATRTLQMSSGDPSCRSAAYLDSVAANSHYADSVRAALPNYPPTPTEMFLPPLPVPAALRGVTVKVEWDIDESGKVLSMTFTETSDPRYNKRLADLLKTFRFRPGTLPDGTPIRMKAQLSIPLP